MYPSGKYIYHLLTIVSIVILGVLPIQEMAGQPCPAVIVRSIQPGLQSASVDWFVNHPSGTIYELEVTRISPTQQFFGQFETSSAPFTILNLEPGTEYRVRIRARCPSNTGNWSSPFSFTTHLLNGASCGMDIPLRLNNCNTVRQEFFIQTSGLNNQLGANIELLELKLLIRHARPDDLDIRLSSPSGVVVQIIRNYGLLQDDMGNVNAPDCSEPLSFSALSCTELSSPGIPLRGSVQPFESYTTFNDGSNPNGLWKLSICDRHNEDQGFLIGAELVFNTQACTPPDRIDIISLTGTRLDLRVQSSLLCGTSYIEVVPEGNTPGLGDEVGHPDNILVPVLCGIMDITIPDLVAGSRYTIYSRTQCAVTSYSDNDCGLEIQTLCEDPSLRSHFDLLAICEENCAVRCTLDPIWQNDTTQSLQWIIHTGPTPTSDTGPESDFFGLGNYIYVPASNPDCLEDGPARLLSECLHIGALTSDCHMQFSFHQFGIQSGSFTLEITTDGGLNWGSLFSRSGNLGNEWMTAYIDLSDYEHLTVQLRFSAQPEGPRGNIALDEILFFGNIDFAESEYTFYADKDGDGYGDPEEFIIVCFPIPPEGYVEDNTDCDDTNPEVNPGVEEIPCNLIDDNCSGVIDDAETDLIITGMNVFNATCVGVTDGSVQFDIQGGHAPYLIEIYQLDEAFSKDSLPVGTYAAVISDANGCQLLSDSFSVIAPQLLQVDVINLVNNSCVGLGDGTIVLGVNGGEAPYDFVWDDGLSGYQRDDLKEGVYRISVSDAQGCLEEIGPLMITAQNNIPVSLIELTDPGCADRSDGVIRLRINGDPTPYEFIWSNGIIGPTARFLSEGIYTVTISDTIGGCSVIKEYTLNAPEPISIEVNALDPASCFGSQTGRVSILVSGGTPSYSYLWSNGTNQYFTRNLNNVPAGQYQINVTDARNCSVVSAPIVIGSPASFMMDSLEIKHNNCLLSENGSITPHISGGTPAYQFFWSNGSQENQLQNLKSGNYILTITDQLNCKNIFTPIEIRNLNIPLNANISKIDHTKCFGDRIGKITASLEDGQAPFEFHWSTGLRNFTSERMDSIVQLNKGTYGVTITDAAGCFKSLPNIHLTGPDAPISYTVMDLNNITCNGDMDGTIQVSASGGTLPYLLQWNDGNTGNLLENLRSGSYRFTLTDANDCQFESTNISLTEPATIALNSSIQEENCATSEGSIAVNVSGGISPYDYTWTFQGDTLKTNSLQQIPCGVYHLTVMDFNGCVQDTTFYIGTTSASDLSFQEKDYKIYPNPFRHEIAISTNQTDEEKPVRIEILNSLGTTVFVQKDVYLPARLSIPSHLPSGWYAFKIIDGGKVWSQIRIKQ